MGWVPAFLAGNSETAEQTFWRTVRLDNLVVYDIGAFHGLLTLLFSRKARQVVSFEPNSRNYARLSDNVHLNKLSNVTMRKLGLGAQTQVASMEWDPMVPGGARVGEQASSGAQTEQVQIRTLDEEVANNLPPPDFIKIDVEGLELDVLRGARNTLLSAAPDLFIEIHGDTMAEKKRNAAEVAAFVMSVGYSDLHHIESGQAIDGGNTAIAAQGHLYCKSTRRTGRPA